MNDRHKKKALKSPEDETLEGETIEADEIEQEDIPQANDFSQYDDSELEQFLTPKQRVFCKVYTSDEEVLGNGTRSYAKAYGISEQDLVSKYKSVQVCSSKLLSNAMICRWINYILDLKISPEKIDSILAGFAYQKDDKKIAIEAIKEINKLKGRIIEKREDKLTFDGPAVMIMTEKEGKELESEKETDIP